jgi:hypothetical protein
MPELPQPVITVQLVPLTQVPIHEKAPPQFQSPVLAAVGPAP